MKTLNQWHLSGNAAERYERVLVPVMFAPWAADLVALARLRPGERVLDVTCGAGVVARLGAERVGPASWRSSLARLLCVGRAGGRSELACGKQECKTETRDVTHDEIGAQDVKSYEKT